MATVRSSGRTPQPRGAAGHPVLIGVFIGLLLGLCLALGVALYLNKMSPFAPREPRKEAPAAKEPPLAALPSRTGPPAGLPQSTARAPESKEEGKPRFDFYEILPGKQEPAAHRDSKEQQEREVTYLQVGAFQKSSDADNLKARLALAGLEAQIQTATLSDNSVWHRVRLGPYATTVELDRARAVLRENKIEPSVIKVTVRDPKS